MLSKHISRFTPRIFSKRLFHSCKTLNKEEQINPITRTLRILGNDLRSLSPFGKQNEQPAPPLFPSHTDVLIIGGGIMGTSAAYWLREKSGHEGVSVTVVEKDPTFSKSSTTLSVGGLRQQFSLPENIQMSLFGAEFLRTIKDRFGPESDVCFTPNGYLSLAGPDGVEQLRANHKVQIELGAHNILLTKEQMKEKFSWLNLDGVELGCLGLEKEGWFDPWSLLSLMKQGATNWGCRFVHGEVIEFLFEQSDYMIGDHPEASYEGTNHVTVRLPSGEEKTITFSKCIIAAGSESNDVAKLARIGTGTGLLSVPLPVERRKRYVYNIACQGEPPGINTPLVVDKTGAYFRRSGLGGQFICGMSPSPDEEPATGDLEVDYDYFDKNVWPILAERVPAFNSIKVRNAWSGYYEYNYYDQNGIIGPHPYYHNMYLATGFSGHGIQQAPAVGRALAELILDGKFQTIDLTRFGFNRLIVDKPMYEIGII